MYALRQFKLISALIWTWRVLLWSGLYAAALCSLHHLLGHDWVRLPGLPISVLGTAVAFYLGFKGNAAYGRMWEARKIWGGIVNTSRTWGVFVTTLVTDLHRDTPGEAPIAEVRRELIYRHVAWMAALRTQLRRPKHWEHNEPLNDRWREVVETRDMSDDRMRRRMAPYIGEAEIERVLTRRNPAAHLVHRQGERLTELFAEGRIDDFRHMEMVNVLEELFTLQGKCERIKNFPLPRQYATVNHWFVTIFIVLLPLALLDAFHGSGLPAVLIWLTVPLSMVVSWVFFIWDMVVDYTENPFEGLVNDIPMDTMSRAIEIDIRQMLDEEDLPPQRGLRGNGALM